MARNWDYSNLSRNASMNGGPNEYVELIKNQGFLEGLAKGRLEGRKEGLVLSGILVIGIVAYGGYKAYIGIKEKRERKILLEQKERAKEAECELSKIKITSGISS